MGAALAGDRDLGSSCMGSGSPCSRERMENRSGARQEHGMVSGHVPGRDTSLAICHRDDSKGMPEELSFFQPPGLFMHKSWK